MTGRVVAFDDAVGLGEIELGDGRRLGFHCTAIVDGTRTITAGSQVELEVVAGHRGLWEAARVRPRAAQR